MSIILDVEGYGYYHRSVAPINLQDIVQLAHGRLDADMWHPSMTLVVLSGMFTPSGETPRVIIHDVLGLAQGLWSCRVAVTADQALESATIQYMPSPMRSKGGTGVVPLIGLSQ